MSGNPEEKEQWRGAEVYVRFGFGLAPPKQRAEKKDDSLKSKSKSNPGNPDPDEGESTEPSKDDKRWRGVELYVIGSCGVSPGEPNGGPS